MTAKAGWAPIREARAEAKKAFGNKAPSPTLMVAWAMVRAMSQHPIFCCTVTPDDTLAHNETFDFGIAVALEQDALDTAIIPEANTLDGATFIEAYLDAVEAVRRGESRSKASVPLILTSMGGFSVRDAQPLVVPPAIGTLFLGESHWERREDTWHEEVSLCLSFDHRWMNGAAGARFLQEVKREMESFSLETLKA